MESEMSKYINKKLCSDCEGKCCKQCGCEYAPSDFRKISVSALRTEIAKGHISIDWWEGDPTGKNKVSQAYYLRARNKNAGIVDSSWGGKCGLLTETGCLLSFKKRPKGGRMVIPKENGRCTNKYGKQQAAIDWMRYHDILEELRDSYYGN